MTQHFDMVILNGKVVFRDKVMSVHIGIKDQIISAIFDDTYIDYIAKEIVDAKFKYVLPGLIDSHVHFRTPGLTKKENWEAGSKAAVAGGVTTVIDMPNTNPYLTTIPLMYEKIQLIKNNSYVDYGFHFGVEPNKTDQLEALEPEMVASIKVFLTGHHTAKNVITEPSDLDNIFRIASKKDIIVTLHAEDDEILNIFKEANDKPQNLSEYDEYLPKTAGLIAIGKILELIKKHKTKVHVLHISSKDEADLLIAAAKVGYSITFETTAHQLWFDAITNENSGAKVKLSPAIRTEKDKLGLWDSLVRGFITSIGSDHAPHTIIEKEKPFFEAPPGLPGVQEMLSVVITGLIKHYPNMSYDEVMCHVVSVLAYGPANLFGISHKKGEIKVGLDADFVILDLDKEWLVKNEDIFSLCKWSAYEGVKLKTKPLITIRRGEIIFNNGVFGTKKGKALNFRN